MADDTQLYPDPQIPVEEIVINLFGDEGPLRKFMQKETKINLFLYVLENMQMDEENQIPQKNGENAAQWAVSKLSEVEECRNQTPSLRLEIVGDGSNHKKNHNLSVCWEATLSDWEAIQNSELITSTRYPRMTLKTSVVANGRKINHEDTFIFVSAEEELSITKLTGDETMSEEHIANRQRSLRERHYFMISNDDDGTLNAYTGGVLIDLSGASYKVYILDTYPF